MLLYSNASPLRRRVVDSLAFSSAVNRSGAATEAGGTENEVNNRKMRGKKKLECKQSALISTLSRFVCAFERIISSPDRGSAFIRAVAQRLHCHQR